MKNILFTIALATLLFSCKQEAAPPADTAQNDPPPATTYTVTFEANGGQFATGAKTSYTVVEGQALSEITSFPAISYPSGDKRVAYWSTAIGDTSTEFKLGVTKVTHDTTVYPNFFGAKELLDKLLEGTWLIKWENKSYYQVYKFTSARTDRNSKCNRIETFGTSSLSSVRPNEIAVYKLMPLYFGDNDVTLPNNSKIKICDDYGVTLLSTGDSKTFDAQLQLMVATLPLNDTRPTYGLSGVNTDRDGTALATPITTPNSVTDTRNSYSLNCYLNYPSPQAVFDTSFSVNSYDFVITANSSGAITFMGLPQRFTFDYTVVDNPNATAPLKIKFSDTNNFAITLYDINGTGVGTITGVKQ